MGWLASPPLQLIAPAWTASRVAAVASLDVTASASAGGEATKSRHHQLSGSNWSGVSVLAGSTRLLSSTPWGFQYLQNSCKDTAQAVSIDFVKKRKVLDFVQWVNYYCFALFDFVFFFFCILLTSLIRLVLWLTLSYRHEAGGGDGMRGGSVL